MPPTVSQGCWVGQAVETTVVADRQFPHPCLQLLHSLYRHYAVFQVVLKSPAPLKPVHLRDEWKALVHMRPESVRLRLG